MTALTIVLVGALAASSGPERISVETQQRFMGNGYWAAIVQVGFDAEVQAIDVKFEPGKIIVNGEEAKSCKWVDEGRGRCRLIVGGTLNLEGIYQSGAGNLIICMGEQGNRPIRFCADEKHVLIILKPVQPPKK